MVASPLSSDSLGPGQTLCILIVLVKPPRAAGVGVAVVTQCNRMLADTAGLYILQSNHIFHTP